MMTDFSFLGELYLNYTLNLALLRHDTQKSIFKSQKCKYKQPKPDKKKLHLNY